MSGNSLALDTSRAVAILNGQPDAVASIQGYSDICLPVPVVAELRFGALNSRNVAQNLARIDNLVAGCRILPATAQTAEQYARVRVELKRNGTPIPENDLWIAALCVEHNILLATDDAHFNVVPGLRLALK